MAAMTAPYFQETGLATIPGAAFLEEVVLLPVELELALALALAETEEAATALLLTRALLVWTAEEETEEELAIFDCMYVWWFFYLMIISETRERNYTTQGQQCRFRNCILILYILFFTVPCSRLHEPKIE